MTLFNPEINSIEEDILYHETQIQEAQERLDQVKVSQAFSDAVISSLEDFLDNTDPFLYEVLRGHINQMFEGNKLTYNNDLNQAEEEDDIEYLEEGDPDYKSIEQIQEEEPDTVVAVFHSEEHLESKGITPTTKEEKKEFGSLSYYEVTGRPDTRPDTFEDLAPNITYSSSGRAYVGFNNKQEAEEFRKAISEPSMLSTTDTMNGFKYEVKFYCSKEYVQEIANSINSMSDEPVDNFEVINPRVLYSQNDKTVYIGMTAKNRCDYYGQVLTGQLTVGEKYTYSNKHCVAINAEEYKYELRITEIELDDAVHLASFNLQKDPEHPDNAKLLTDWRATKVRELNLCKPSPKPISIEEVKLGDVVYLNSIDNQYKVLSKVELEGSPHLEVINVFNSERPSLVGNTSYLKECYLVPVDEIRVSTRFQEQEEVLTETVQIYVPKKKPVKVSVHKLEAGDTVHRGIGDSQYEVIGTTRKDNDLYAECRLIFSSTRAASIGNTYFFKDGLYLVEEESVKPSPVAV